MRLAASIGKSLKENLRDWKVLSLVLAFSPFFVLLMRLFYGGGETVYSLGIVDKDKGEYSARLLERLEGRAGERPGVPFKARLLSDPGALQKLVKDKTVDAGIVIPEGYSEKLAAVREGRPAETATVDYFGSMGNARYAVAAVMSANEIYAQGIEASGAAPPTGIRETFLEKKRPLNEFEGYVPGLISLAVLMVIFSATASIVKESDRKTVIRIKLSRLGAFRFLAGISVVQAAICMLAMSLAYWAAVALGYRPAGSFWAALAVGALSSLSMVAISLVMASFLNTVFDVLTVGVFPFFILMFFSGSMFPLPAMNLLTVGTRSFGVPDLLPLKHAAEAFNKILNYGAGLGDVRYELAMTAILTLLYGALGLRLYGRRKLSKA
jgi:ABC-2 type transport system permease protein